MLDGAHLGALLAALLARRIRLRESAVSPHSARPRLVLRSGTTAGADPGVRRQHPLHGDTVKWQRRAVFLVLQLQSLRHNLIHFLKNVKPI